MILRSRVVVTMAGPPIENGAVALHGDRVAGVGRFDDLRRVESGEVIDLGESVLMPGLINGHCHLDYTILRRAISRQKNFTDWIRRINAVKRSLRQEDYVTSIQRGIDELLRWGTTTVLNVESFPELLSALPAPAIRAWWFYEMIDLRHPISTEESIYGALQFFDGVPGWHGGFGLSPHAPYTASLDLYRLVTRCAASLQLPVMTHVAESADEDQMFRDGDGPLHHFVAGLGRDMSDCRGRSSFANLIEAGCVTTDTILVHMNELGDSDFELLKEELRRGAINVVHCPRSHAYFAHRPFAFERLHGLGVNICLGTDSLASCESLSLFAELQCARDAQPWMDPAALLGTVTVNPARALKMEGRLGALVPGAFADLICLPFEGSLGAVHDTIIANQQPVEWVMINGQALH